jgi:hypothetical protein
MQLSILSGKPALLLHSGVNNAAANDGAEDAGFGELGGGNFGEVVRKDDEIGVLTGLQFTLLPFLELSIRGT